VEAGVTPMPTRGSGKSNQEYFHGVSSERGAGFLQKDKVIRGILVDRPTLRQG